MTYARRESAPLSGVKVVRHISMRSCGRDVSENGLDIQIEVRKATVVAAAARAMKVSRHTGKSSANES